MSPAARREQWASAAAAGNGPGLTGGSAIPDSGCDLAVLAGCQAVPALGDGFVAHAQADGYGLGRDVVRVGQRDDLLNPRFGCRREDRASCFGHQSLALVMRMQVPAHFDLARWPSGIGNWE